MGRSRILIALAAFIAVAVLTFTLAKRQIGERLFARAVAQNVGIDRSLALGDGLHVYVCGSGSPLPDAARAGPCLGVIAGRDAFVFDAGSGAIRKLGRMGFPMDRLRAAFVTHLHSDHIDGLGELMLQAWVAGGRSVPLPIYGPARIDEVVRGLIAAYTPDQGFRVAHHGAATVRPAGFGAEARIITIPMGDPGRIAVWSGNGVTITAVRVHHEPIAPAFGYRIDYRGRSVTISGDTVYAPELAAAARGSDVVFHEALNPAMVGQIRAALLRHGRTDAAKIMGDIPGYHASPEDAARLATEAGARALVLYHLVPAPPSHLLDAAFLGNARKRFAGPIRLADDGLIVSLPAGSKAINYSKGF